MQYQSEKGEINQDLSNFVCDFTVRFSPIRFQMINAVMPQSLTMTRRKNKIKKGEINHTTIISYKIFSVCFSPKQCHTILIL